MAFKYRGGERTSEDVTRRSKMSGGSYDNYLSSDAPFFKAREGDNEVRIMPRTWDDEEKWGTGWEIVVYFHRNVGPDNATYLCLDKMKGERCPICDARADMDEDEANAVRVQARPLCYIIDRNNEKAGPQIMGMPMTLFREINARSVHKKTGSVLRIDGDKDLLGHDVAFVREGTDKKTTYSSVEVYPEKTNLGPDEKRENRWLDFVEDHPLPEMLVYFDPEHIEKVLFGKAERRRGDDADGGEEEDRRGRSRRGRGSSDDQEEDRPRRGKARDQDEEQDDRPSRRGSSRNEDDDTGENERPSRRRSREEETEEETSTTRSRGRRGGDDDDDEPEGRSSRSRRGDDDDEEGDRASRRRRTDDGDKGKGGGVERRRYRSSESESDDDDDSPSGRAKSKLERLKNRR